MKWSPLLPLALVIAGCGKQEPSVPATGRAPAVLPPSAPSVGDPPVAAPGAVVVRWATGRGDAIVARCKLGERLLGGGCDGGSSTSYPSVPVDFQPGDTIAAGWKCDFFGMQSPRLVAYAMCQGIAPAPATAPAASGSKFDGPAPR